VRRKVMVVDRRKIERLRERLEEAKRELWREDAESPPDSHAGDVRGETRNGSR
jgi:hypothetical protein